MKKIVAILTALMLCAAFMVPAFAADDFVPSVTNPLAPEIVPVPDPDGVPAAGVIKAYDVIIEYVYDCIVVTPVSKAETSELIPDDAKALLLEVYDQLTSGEMEIPYWKHNAGLDPDDMVIRDLFDVTFLCGEHPEMLEPVGVTFTITFDLGVEAGVDVYAMTYKGGEWNPVVSCTNNDDGSVTVVAENFCPIEFSVEVPSEDPDDPTCPEWPTLPEWPTCPDITEPEWPTCPDVTEPEWPTCPDLPSWPEWDWPEWDWPEWDWPEWDWPEWDLPEWPELPECPEWPEWEWPECPEWPEWPECPEWPTCPDWDWPTCPDWEWPTCPEKPTCPDVTEPSEEVTEPSEEVTEPSEEITEPSEEVTEPSEEITEPSEEVTEPSEEITEPSEEVTEPSEEITEPSEEVTEPSEEITEPSEEVTEPSEEATEPEATESEKPAKPADPVDPPVQTGDIIEDLMVWGGIALVCLIAVIALTIAYTRMNKKEDK